MTHASNLEQLLIVNRGVLQAKGLPLKTISEVQGGLHMFENEKISVNVKRQNHDHPLPVHHQTSWI